ncbi:LysM peptidoglycan-binding domain-containing protein [Rubrivirga sp. IMCC43871]|uniref:lytic transglycosylase domain-containing protein n=1 Tax=Rubrivirga sp. IMCC43871 TaxID=3391575 RepID=UPI00398FFC81
MPRLLLAAALLVVSPAVAGAQTAQTDTAPVRPTEVLAASADARLPASFSADQVSDTEFARRIAAFYQRQAALLEAEASGDDDRVAVLLDDLVADVQAAALRPGALSDARFRELFSTVVTEYERYYDRPLVDRGGVYAIRAAGIRAIERGIDEGTPLLEHVTLPDVATFVATIPMDVNPKVERYLQFLLNRPSHVQRLRSRADTYFPMVERVLAEEGVPDEMKYLAMVESALNPVARSHMAAAGMWQFISATGRAYGLRAERDIDDRLDPEASTRAAARHLRDLYDRFGSWHLALAGYNCNPAVIARGVRRFEEQTGRTATFWDIDHVIPSETRAYVPMFIATALILSNPDAYGFEAHEPGPAYVFDRVPVEGGTRLTDVARILGTDVEVLSALNPSIRRGRVPDIRGPHMLRVPAGTYAEHAEPLDRLAPPEANGQQFAAGTVSFGPRAVRPLAPQEHSDAVANLVARRDLRRQLQPRRADRSAPVQTYAAATPRDVASTEARYAIARQAEGAREASQPEVLLTAAAARRAPVAVASEPLAEVANELADPAPAASAVARGSVAETAPEEIVQVEIAAVTPVPVQRSAVALPAPSAPSAAPPVRTVSAPATHAVQRGEYLLAVARQYGMSLADLRALNPGVGDNLAVGQRLRVSGTPAPPVAASRRAAPARPTTHRVRSGEHLTGLAQRYGVTVRELRDWNDLSSDVLQVGQRLRVTERGSRG